MVYGTQITIVTGAYKPTYNWWGATLYKCLAFRSCSINLFWGRFYRWFSSETWLMIAWGSKKSGVETSGSMVGKFKNILGEAVFFHKNQTYIYIIIIIIIIYYIYICICILALGFTHPEENPRFWEMDEDNMPRPQHDQDQFSSSRGSFLRFPHFPQFQRFDM